MMATHHKQMQEISPDRSCWRVCSSSQIPSNQNQPSVWKASGVWKHIALLPVHVLVHVPHESPITFAQDDVESPGLHQILGNPRITIKSKCDCHSPVPLPDWMMLNLNDSTFLNSSSLPLNLKACRTEALSPDLVKLLRSMRALAQKHGGGCLWDGRPVQPG